MRSIVVGIGGSRGGADPGAFAEWLARLHDARLILVDVYSTRRVPDDLAGGAILPHAEAQAAQQTLARARSAVSADLDVDVRAMAGESAAEALRHVAGDERAAMIVLGSTHVGRLRRVLPGSTAERLLHAGPCPVAVVPAGYAEHPGERIGRIGVAVDRSAEAHRALDGAVELARATRSELSVMSAVEMAWNGTPALVDGPAWAAIRDELAGQVRSELESTVHGTPDDVEASGVVLEGDVAAELTHRTRRLDVLFMGSRGLGPFHAALVGGVSGRVIREAHCPVVVTPPGESVGELELQPRDVAASEPPTEEQGFETVMQFLRRRGIECAVTEHRETFTAGAEARASAVSADRTAKAVMLGDADGYVMALIPASRQLDVVKARRLTRRPGLELAPEPELAAAFPRFELGAFPPFGALFDAPELIDDRLLSTPRVLCNGGDHRHSIVIDARQLRLASGAQVGDLSA